MPAVARELHGELALTAELRCSESPIITDGEIKPRIFDRLKRDVALLGTCVTNGQATLKHYHELGGRVVVGI